MKEGLTLKPLEAVVVAEDMQWMVGHDYTIGHSECPPELGPDVVRWIRGLTKGR